MEATYRQVEINSRGERVDKFLTGNPEISFFKQESKRYYAYARNTRAINFETNPNFGTTSIIKLNRYGDLVGSINLELELPPLVGTSTIGYCNNIGHAIIDWVEIEIGGNQIVRLYGEWLHINRELSNKYDQKITHRELTQYYENITPNSFNGGKVIVPLTFWFTENSGLFLPLSAICRHDIIIRVKFHPISRLWISNDNSPPIGNYNITNAALLVDYYVLDQQQKKMFAPIYNDDGGDGDGSNEVALYPPKINYKIQQVQQLKVSIPGNQTKFKIDLDSINFSVGYFVWVLRRTDVSTTNDWFNFTNVLTGPAIDPLISAQIYFGEKERTDVLSAKNLRLLEPYKTFGNASEDYIYCYFYNLYPNNKVQPSGSANFTFLSDVNLVLNTIGGLPEMEILLYAVNHNLLNVENGQCWLQYLLSN
jgi:hypothetical protein